MKESGKFKDKFNQDGYLWGYKQGEVMPTRIRRKWTIPLRQQLTFISIAIAIFVCLGVLMLGFSIFIPGKTLILTKKYNLQTFEVERSYIGYNEPFSLSGTMVLWCNRSLITFPSSGTVTIKGAELDEVEGAEACR